MSWAGTIITKQGNNVQRKMFFEEFYLLGYYAI
jgi:hypothetical protein